MGHNKLFDSCNDSVSGIKYLYILTKKSDSSSITYPIDIVFVSGGTDTIPIEFDALNRLISINGTEYMFRELEARFADFDQEIVETRQGIVYRKTLSFAFPRLDLFTNNNIRDYLFDRDGDFAISQLTALIVDNNNHNWIVGFDLPLVIDEFDAKTSSGGGENSYALSYSSKSYLPALKYIIT